MSQVSSGRRKTNESGHFPLFMWACAAVMIITLARVVSGAAAAARTLDNGAAWHGLALTVVAVLAMLVTESRRDASSWRRGVRPPKMEALVWAAKPLAAFGFVLVAWRAPGWSSDATLYPPVLFAGLVCCFCGDVLLIPGDSPLCFKLGIASFLLGHICFACAFSFLGMETMAMAWSSIVASFGVYGVKRWLAPHVPSDLSVPVNAYVYVISFMIVCAVGCTVHTGRMDIITGAILFYLSDLSVARNSFVKPGFQNVMWGLPLYFTAQIVLALSIVSHDSPVSSSHQK